MRNKMSRLNKMILFNVSIIVMILFRASLVISYRELGPLIFLEGVFGVTQIETRKMERFVLFESYRNVKSGIHS
jgi:hypothetical protein